MSDMRRMLAIVAIVLGCEAAEPEPVAPSCSDLREAIVLECESEGAAVLECAGEVGFPGDCPSELEALNECTTEAKASHDPSPELDAARDLAYFCDLLADEWMCEMIEDDAPSKGVTECPLPEHF